MSPQRFQVLIIGSGFAGSLMAMIARRLGFTTALIERGRHPRFVIGESSTPLTNLLLEELCDKFELPFVRPLCKWGAWQATMPQLACGLKRGFTFYHHQLDEAFGPDPERRRQLLVGASPNETIADTHWYRPDLDHYLVEQAQKLGVAYFDEVELTGILEEPGGLRLAGQRQGANLALEGEFVIDASGARGFLYRTLGLPERPFPKLPPTQALFSHFRGVAPLPENLVRNGPPFPYPPEQAAVHHVFPAGWIWVLKFNNGLTSAGVAATDFLANALNFARGEAAWQALLRRLPTLAQSFKDSEAVLPFVHHRRVAFRAGRIVGSRWALLPSAAGVVDPLLSTGFPLTLLGVGRLAEILVRDWQSPAFASRLADYARITELELESTATLVGALYATMDRFELFKALSLLYFAAATYAEAARRPGKPHLANAFLLCGHPAFSTEFQQLCALATEPLSPRAIERFSARAREAIQPFDVAGLTDRSRDPWYPARAADLRRAASKLNATQTEIDIMLQRCGFSETEDQQ